MGDKFDQISTVIFEIKAELNTYASLIKHIEEDEIKATALYGLDLRLEHISETLSILLDQVEL